MFSTAELTVLLEDSLKSETMHPVEQASPQRHKAYLAEPRTSARSAACPPYWLPMLLAVHMPLAQPPLQSYPSDAPALRPPTPSISVASPQGPTGTATAQLAASEVMEGKSDLVTARRALSHDDPKWSVWLKHSGLAAAARARPQQPRRSLPGCPHEPRRVCTRVLLTLPMLSLCELLGGKLLKLGTPSLRRPRATPNLPSWR